jgi:hypothetical protein
MVPLGPHTFHSPKTVTQGEPKYNCLAHNAAHILFIVIVIIIIIIVVVVVVVVVVIIIIIIIITTNVCQVQVPAPTLYSPSCCPHRMILRR